MRVLHVIPAIAPRYGGPSRVVTGLCRALAARGVDAMLVTTDADGPGRLPVAAGEIVDHDGIRALFFRRRLGEGFKYASGLARWLRTNVERFEVVHVHALFSHSSLAAARACRRAGVPYVLRPLGSLDPWGLDRKRWRKTALMRLGVGRMIDGASLMHYTTLEEQRRAEQAIGRRPAVIVPPGVESEDTNQSGGPDVTREPVVLALGRLHPVKNLELLIGSFRAAASDARCAGWKLVIAGDGDPAYRTKLERLAQKAGAPVTLVGWVEGAARRDWLSRAALFAQVSHQENFGVALAEALVAGLPALVTPGVGLAADVAAADAGWVVEPNESALALALRDAMVDVADRRRRSAEAAGLGSRFRWTVVAELLEDAYGTVAKPFRSATMPEPSAARAPGRSL